MSFCTLMYVPRNVEEGDADAKVISIQSLHGIAWQIPVCSLINKCNETRKTETMLSKGGVLLVEFIAAVYAEMRGQEAAAKVPHSYTTARTLLSILRLSQSLARLRFSSTIAQVWDFRRLLSAQSSDSRLVTDGAPVCSTSVELR